MPSFGITEPIARALRDQMLTYVPASLRRVEADLGLAPNSLPDPQAYTLGSRVMHAAYPVIEFESIDRGILTDAQGYQKYAARMALITIVTAPAVVGPDTEEGLTLQVWRFARAVVDAVPRARHDAVFDFGVDLQDQLIDYSPTRFIEGDLFARDIFIPVICTKEETRT